MAKTTNPTGGMTRYILVKVETTDIEAVVRELSTALDGDNIYQAVGCSLVCDVNNPDVIAKLDGTDLMQTLTETRVE